MSTWFWILLAALAAVVIVVFVALTVARRRRTAHLQERFGPEYDRAVEDADSRRSAERELTEREEQHDELALQPLSGDARERYAAHWRDVQSRFVDNPGASVREAEQLLEDVLADRGYPDADFDQRAAIVSVGHPERVEGYRSAHASYVRELSGEATTEELRRALVDYRELLDELLEESASPVRPG
jgi:hypothetical protein